MDATKILSRSAILCKLACGSGYVQFLRGTNFVVKYRIMGIPFDTRKIWNPHLYELETM